jgi:imidazolonepropionase-like amidohydrolase
MERGLPAGNESFKKALKAGVKMTFGTDATAGAHGRNAEELIYRVKDGGMDPMAAIVSATSTSAQSLRLDKQIGTIAPGMDADIIATDGNPITDITSVRRVQFVMKGGVVYKNIAVVAKGATGATGARGARGANGAGGATGAKGANGAGSH